MYGNGPLVGCRQIQRSKDTIRERGSLPHNRALSNITIAEVDSAELSIGSLSFGRKIDFGLRGTSKGIILVLLR